MLIIPAPPPRFTSFMNDLNFVPHQLLRKARFTALAMLIVLMLAVTGCNKATHVTTSAAGHQIRAAIEGNHSIESHPNQGVIASPFGKITIERARVQFDDAPWTKIPEGVAVKVSISKHKLFLTAGSVTMKRTIR